MKKSIALILSIIMIMCVSTPLLATEGMTIYFDSGATSQVEFSHKESISFPWDTVPSSSERAIVTLYTPSPVKSIEETAHFIATIPEYLDDWTPENGGSKVNTASKGENDKYITMFQLRACFLDENGTYTKPGADVQAGAIFEETVEVTLENGSWMKIPCKLELLEDATIFWDVSMNKNITFNLNQGNDISAYIGATSDAQAPYTIKWTFDGDAEIIGIKGPSGSTSAGNKTNNIIKPTDKTEFLGSTVTVRPTSTSDFWLGSTLHDNTGKEISNWRVLIRVNGTIDSYDNLDAVKKAINDNKPVEVPTNKGLSKENLQTLKDAGLSHSTVTLKNEADSGLGLEMSFDLSQADPDKVQMPFTPSYTPSIPSSATQNGINDTGSQWLNFTYSGYPPAPITITLRPGPHLANVDNIVVWYYTGAGELVIKTDATKNADGTISFVLDHFSTYALYPQGVNPNPSRPSYDPPSYSSGGSGGGGGSSHSSSSTPSKGILNGSFFGNVNVSNTTTAKTVTVSEATNAAAKAAEQAKTTGKTKSNVRFINPAALPKNVLEAVRNTTRQKGVELTIYADTVVNNAVSARMYVDPAAYTLPGDLKTEVIAGDAAIEAHFAKYFKNKLKAVKFTQQGSFGMDVGVAVQLDLRGLDSSKLVLYSYDLVKNSYSMLPEQTYLIDANGYLHFTTSIGNYVVVSEGPLA